jgi:hypothetical protein
VDIEILATGMHEIELAPRILLVKPPVALHGVGAVPARLDYGNAVKQPPVFR